MIILDKPMRINDILQAEDKEFFAEDRMIKAVADLDKGLLAVNAPMHADLEELLLANGSRQDSLYGFNVYYDDKEIEYDSIINPPRNRDDGFPRGGRDVSSPEKREMIKEVVDKWILD